MAGVVTGILMGALSGIHLSVQLVAKAAMHEFPVYFVHLQVSVPL
jgi:hypothetical protein